MTLKGSWLVAATYLSALLEGEDTDAARQRALATCRKQFPDEDEANSEKRIEALLSVFDVREPDLPSEDEVQLQMIRSIPKDRDLDLWKFYQGRADQIKQQLWTTATWLIAVEGAFVALLFEGQILEFNQSSGLQFAICLPVPAFILAIFGVALSLYSTTVIEDTGKHVNANWSRAAAIIDSPAEPSAFQQTTTYRTTRNALYALMGVFILIGAMSLLQLFTPEMATCVGLGSCPPAPMEP